MFISYVYTLFLVNFLQLTSCTEQIVQLMQERDILQDANDQMNEVSARKLKVSLNVSLCRICINFWNMGMLKLRCHNLFFLGVAQRYIALIPKMYIIF